MKYIENDINKGIEYDWKLLRKDFKTLKIPRDVYDTSKNPFETSNIFVDVSERSVGKTTNWLLLGMLMYVRYGTIIQYIRQNELMITPKNMKDLMETVKKFNYIEKITKGKYNDCIYKARRWNFIHVNDAGEIDVIDNSHFMMCLSIDKSEIYKSSYNAPTGDLIIFDEFTSKHYSSDEFVYFLDLVKTIQRERQSLKIVMLSNTLDVHNQYFHELEIFGTISKMNVGDKRDVITDGGTSIHINFIEPNMKLKEKKSISNMLYYGFKNPKLNAITGLNGTWALKNCQRIPKNKTYKSVDRHIYISHNNLLLNLEIVNIEDIGVAMYVHYATFTYDDSIILTLDFIYDDIHKYKLGGKKLQKMILNMLEKSKIYYASNDVNSLFENYLKLCGFNFF